MKDHDRLLKKAIAARELAYAPYSNFNVGAALLTKDRTIYTGGNIENAAYSLCNCAERTVLFTAYANGVKDYAALAVAAHSDRPISPCGACRQVMAELCEPTMVVLLTNVNGDVLATTVYDLLPNAFSRKDLKNE